MSFKDFVKKKKEEERQGNSSTSSPSSSGASATQTTSQSGTKSFKDFVKEKKSQSSSTVQDWVQSTIDITNDIQSHYSKWQGGDSGKQQYTNYQTQISNLLAQADSWRKQYAGNDEAIKYINTVVSALEDVQDYSFKYHDYYSKWETEDEYNTAVKISGINNMTADELQLKIDEVNANSTDVKAWEKRVKEIDNEKNQLIATARSANPTAYRTRMSELSNERNELQAKIDAAASSRIAYSLPNGSNVTWQSLYDQKKQEEDFNALYGELSSATDWEDAISSATSFSNPSVRDIENGVYFAGHKIGKKGQLVNRVTYYEQNRESIMFGEVNGGGSSIVDSRVNQMTQEEKDIYHYYFGIGEYEKADQYLDSLLEGVLQERFDAREVEVWSKIAEEHEVFASLSSIFLNLASAAEYVSDAIDYAATGELGTNVTAQVASAIRSTVSEQVDWEIGNWDAFDFVYNTGMSGLDSLASTVLFGKFGGIALGLSAAGSATNDALNRGMDNGQAFWHGLFAGVFEGLFETISIGSFSALKETAAKSVKDIALNIGKSMLVNASEETLTEIANIAYDTIANGDFSQYETAIRTRMQYEGMTEEEAKWATAKELAGQIAEAGASGALMGIGFGGAGSARGYANYNRAALAEGSQILQTGGENALKALALEVAGASEGGSTQRIERLANNVTSDQSKSNARTVGKLSLDLDEHRTTMNEADIAAALEEKGMDSKAAKKVAEVINQTYGTKEFTKKQRNAVMKDERAYEVLESVANDETNSVNVRNMKHLLGRLGVKDDDSASQDGAEGASASGKGKSATTEKTVPSEFEVSENGETFLTTTGEAVSVKEIVSIKDGKMTLRLDNGETVNAKDVHYASTSEALVYEAVANLEGMIDAETSNKLTKHLMKLGGASSDFYVNAIKQAYTYGYYGYGREAMTGENTLSSTLTEKQRNVAYGLGERYRDAKVAAEQAEAQSSTVQKKTQPKEEKSTAPDGTAYKKVRFESKVEVWGEKQKAEVAFIDFISSNFSGNTVHVFESYKDENGAFVYEDSNGNIHEAPNGMYISSTGDIYLDLNAGNHGEGLVMNTFAHELVHHIQKRSPAKARKLAEFLVKELGYKNVEAAVQRQINKAERADHGVEFFMKEKGMSLSAAETLVYDRAFNDFVADSLETMFTKGDAVQKLKKLKQQDAGLFNMIKDFIDKWVKKLREFYSNNSTISHEGDMVAQLKSFEKIQQMFVEALVDAGDNYQSSLTHGVEGVIVNQNGDPVARSTNDGTIQLSLRTYDEEGRKAFRDYLNKCVKNKKLTKAEMQEMLDGIEEIYTLCKDFKDKYAPFSSWSDAAVVRDTYGKPVFSVVTPNGDYKMNLDFSLVCKKRRTLDAVFNEMSKRGIIDDFELGQKSVVKINEIIRKYGLETACALCFVDAKRFRQASMADAFTTLYNELVTSLVPENQKSNIEHFNFSGYENIKTVDGGIHTWDASKLDFSHLNEVMKNYGDGTVEYKAAKYIKSHAEGRKLLLRGDFMSSKGFDAVKAQNPDVLKLYNSKKGTGGPKAAFGDVQYMNEVIKKSRFWTPAKAYAVGGIRIQSFSDYVPRMVFDYVQMIYDLAATKLPAHAYTKEALFVKQFGLTGIKINMSLIPAIAEGGVAAGLDANGNYVWAGESFDFETAKQIQSAEGYSENCGTICVGVSDRHIRKLLSDPDIRMVIPYHKSGLNPIVAHMNKIAEFTDYTNKQNTTVIATGAKAEEHFDFNKALHDMGENADPKAVIQQYFDWCDDRGYNPKFPEFRDHPNYYKLIEDFTLYDKDGKYAPQKAVKAVFPKEGDAFGSMKELIQSGLEEDAIVEGKRDSSLSAIVDEIQKTLPKTEAEIPETQVEQADRDLENVMLSDREKERKDHAATIDRYDQRSYTNHGWVAYNGVLNDVEYKSFNKQFAEAILQGYKYPQTDNGEYMITVGDMYSFLDDNGRVRRMQHANKVVFVSGTVQNPIISKVVEVDYTIADDVSYYVEGVIENEQYGIDYIAFIESVERKTIFRTYEGKDFPSYSELRRTQQNGRGLQNRNANRGEQQQRSGSSSESEGSSDVKYSDRSYAPTFYSQMGKVVDAIKIQKMGAGGVVSYLKGKGIKNEEIKWSGIEAFLDGKKSVTKAELQEFVAGSMLQVEEATRDNKEIPYTEDQTKRIDEYTADRDAVAKRLADEWERITGDEFPIRNTGAGLESAVANKIIDVNLEYKRASFEGRLLEKLRKDLKEVIANNDDFGFDSWKDALRSIHRHRKDFAKHYEMTASDKAVLNKYCDALNAFNSMPDKISYDDSDALRDIAKEADALNRKIMDVKNEHYEENAKHQPKWKKYSLDGGENYREIVFRMPDSDYTNAAMGGHWGYDTRGVLAHARIQDFDTANGRMLFIEEIQSDWHNEGHKSGYRDAGAVTKSEMYRRMEKYHQEFFDSHIAKVISKKIEAVGYEGAGVDMMLNYLIDEDTMDSTLASLERKGVSFSDAEAKEISEYTRGYAELYRKWQAAPSDLNAPDAPFKENYHEYVLKRLLRMAAEDGYDSIGWTTSDSQMERWNPDRKTNAEMDIESKNPDAIAFEEGYRIEYDQDIPKFLRKYGKKWGATVGTATAPDGTEIWSMDITDSMKESVLYEGQVMYSDRDYSRIGSKAVMTADRIDDLIEDSGAGKRVDYANAWITSISPTDFLNMTTTLAIQNRENFDKYPSEWNDDATMDTYDYLGELKKNRQTPYLAININTGKVMGHEGRHRLRALEREGITSVEIMVEFKDDDYRIEKYSPDGKRLKIKDVVNISNQFDTKQTATITNVIPLNEDYRSEIFANYGESFAKGGDVLYSDRDAEGSVSNRSILSRALESAAQNDIELKRIKEYQEKISLLDQADARLAELRAEIRELTFAKGYKDTVRIRELQSEATRIANRINTYDKQLLRLEASKPLENVLQREKEAIRKREKQKSNKAMAEYRDKMVQREKALREHYQESRKKAVEGREKTAMRHKIRKFKENMERKLLHPTDRQYVPADLVKAMVDVCDLINTDTSLYKADGSINKAQVKRDNTKAKLQNLKDEYEKLGKHPDPAYAGEFDEVVYGYLTELVERYGGRTLSEMALDELIEMYDMLRAIDDTLTDARKLIGWGDSYTVYEAGDAIVSEQNAITQKRKNGKRNAAQKAFDSIDNMSLSPVRAVEKMSGYDQDSVLLELFKKFEQGIRKKNMFVMRAYKLFEGLSSGKQYEDAMYKEFGGKKYTDVNGRKFGLSKMQMMQAILSYERESANGMNHIVTGGFTFADLDMLSKGRLRDAISEEYSHRIPAAVGMVAEFTEALKGDKWCQDYMAVARKFFNEDAKGAINETMLVLKHRIIAKDKSYIPFEVDKNFVTQEISSEQAMQQTINSYGMLKETQDNAPQALIITGLNNVIDRHIDLVGNVYGLAVEVRNYNKVWNVRALDAVGSDPTVKAAIQRNWGVKGVGLIEQAVKDIQGARVRERSAVYDFVKSGYITATFTLNLSVVTKQIGSLFSATSMLRWRNPVSMISNLVYTMVNHKKIAAEVDKYTASAWMRRQGMSDAELSTLMTQAKKNRISRAISKLPPIINPTKWITAMDHAVALSLWRYAKQDTAKATGLEGEELLKATAKFYDDVVENTQSMTDVLHRPEIQKRGDVVSEAFSMFKTDLYQMAGQLHTAAGRYAANKSKENGKALARTLYSVGASAVWGQLMTTAFALIRYSVKQYRDDEDDEITYESWLKRQLMATVGDFMGYIFPIFGSELVGVFENIMFGESDDIVDNIALDTINGLYENIVTIATSIKDGEEISPYVMQKLTTAVLQMFGVPANNIIRIHKAIALHAEDIANGEFLSFEAGADRSAEQQINRIIEAMDEGNPEVSMGMYEDALDEMATKKADGGEYGDEEREDVDSALKTALGEKYKNGEVSRSTAEKVMSIIFDMSYEDIYWKLDEWDHAKENGSTDDYSKYGDFYEAVETGRNLNAVIKEYKDNGVTDSTLSTQITSHFKPLYAEMSTRERANIKGYLLNAYERCGVGREVAENKIGEWQFEADHPELVDTITYTDYKRWETDGKPNGVPAELFVEVAKFRDDGTSNSVKKQDDVRVYIDSLPISVSQKHGLWCCFYKASTSPWY